MYDRKKELIRFFKHVKFLPSECWEWQGYIKSQGYGQMAVIENGKYVSRLAHVMGYRLLIGEKPDGLDLDHLCHTLVCISGKECPHRRCVNPQHLKPVTRKENLGRGHHNNRGRTHCRREHELTPDNISITTIGSRQCLACIRLRNPLHPHIPITHCKWGHELTKENTVSNKRQKRICRICKNARTAAYKQRLKEK